VKGVDLDWQCGTPSIPSAVSRSGEDRCRPAKSRESSAAPATRSSVSRQQNDHSTKAAVVMKTRTQFGKRALFACGPRILNQVPPHIMEPSFCSALRRALKTYLFLNSRHCKHYRSRCCRWGAITLAITMTITIKKATGSKCLLKQVENTRITRSHLDRFRWHYCSNMDMGQFIGWVGLGWIGLGMKIETFDWVGLGLMLLFLSWPQKSQVSLSNYINRSQIRAHLPFGS